jgi:TH1 protein
MTLQIHTCVQDTLLLMAHLMAGGFVVHVLAHFTASLQGPARLDQSLVRYFLSVVFTMAQPRPNGGGYRCVVCYTACILLY